MDFLKEKGLVYEYLRYKDPAYQTGEEELPFLRNDTKYPCTINLHGVFFFR